MSVRDSLIDWLRDAYAMERGLEITLRKQSENDELNGEMRKQAAMHLEQTKAHAEAVKACLEQLGSDTSTLKTTIAQVTETVKGMGTAFTQDERVKDSLVAYASEHFEIACYKALHAAALSAGEPMIAQVCDRIIPDEVRMAAWLDQHMPEVVGSYLREHAAAA